MSRVLKALGGITALAVVTTLLGPPPARALPDDEASPRPTFIQVVATADKPGHLNGSVKVDLPPGGTAQVTSATVDPSLTSAKVEVTNIADDPEFDHIAVMLNHLPKPGQRVRACLAYAFGAVDLGTDKAALEQIEAEGADIVIAVIFFCLLIAKAIADAKAPAARVLAKAPPPGCASSPLRIGTTTEQTSGGYTVSATPDITLSKKKMKLKVKCRKIGNKLVYTIKPRKKGKSLRSVVGPNIRVGLASPAGATSSLPLRVGFKEP
jgi:hypothetical protein